MINYFIEVDNFISGLKKRGFQTPASKFPGGIACVVTKNNNKIGDVIIHNNTKTSELFEVMGFGISEREDGDFVISCSTATEVLMYVDRYVERNKE